MKVNFLSALDSFPLFNFTVSPGEKMCFTGCFSVDTTVQHKNTKLILKIEPRNWQREDNQVECPNQHLNFEFFFFLKMLSFEVGSPFKGHEKF